MISSAHSISRGNVGEGVTDDCHAFGGGLQDAILTKRDQVPRSAGPDPLPGEKRRGLWCAGPYPQKRYPRPAHRGPLGRSVTIFSSMVRRHFSSGSRLPGLMGCSIFMFYHPLNLQKRRETIRSRREFICAQWLCCSTFAPKSHPSSQKVLTLRANYHISHLLLGEGSLGGR